MKHLMTVVAATLILASCTKPKDDTQTTSQFDFTEFPGNCTIELKSNVNGQQWKLSTDSLRYYDLTLPVGMYTVKWTLFNIKTEKGKKAKISNPHHGMVRDWENGSSTMHNWGLEGLHKFTKTN